MNDDLWKAIEADGQADADAFENLTTEGATELASMVRHLISLQSELVEAEQKVKDLKSKVMRYTHDRIPAKMQETGLDEAKVGATRLVLPLTSMALCRRILCNGILHWRICVILVRPT